MYTKLRAGVWLLSATFVPAFCAGTPASAQTARKHAAAISNASDSASKVAATVNGEKITRGEVVDMLMADQAANLNATSPTFQGKQRAFANSAGALLVKKMAANGWKPVTITRAEVIDFAFTDKPDIVVKTVERLIQERAIAQEAKKQGVKVAEKEVTDQMHSSIANARKTYHMDGQSDAQVLQAMGFRPAYLRPFVVTQLLLEKLMKKESGSSSATADYRGASHILIMVKPDPADKDGSEKAFVEAKKKIDGIAQDIKSGKISFEQAASQYSDDQSKFQQGSLGIFPRGKMVPEFDKAVFSQEKGKIGEPVRTQFGWHLIRVDRLGTDLTAPERAAIEQRDMATKLPAKVQAIVSAAKVTNTVAAPKQQQGMMPGG